MAISGDIIAAVARLGRDHNSLTFAARLETPRCNSAHRAGRHSISLALLHNATTNISCGLQTDYSGGKVHNTGHAVRRESLLTAGYRFGPNVIFMIALLILD